MRSHWERCSHCQEDQAAFKDPNMTSWWALEQEYQRPCYAAREQKDELLQKPNVVLMTGEWKSAFLVPTLINLFFNYSSADEVSYPLPSPVPVMSYNNCSSWSERSLDENWSLDDEGSLCHGEIASEDERWGEVCLDHSTERKKKLQKTWRGGLTIKI